MYTKYKPFLHLIPGQKLCGSCRKSLPLWLNEQKEPKVSKDENNCKSEEGNQQNEKVQYDTLQDNQHFISHDW
jgi:hypothetical protein